MFIFFGLKNNIIVKLCTFIYELLNFMIALNEYNKQNCCNTVTQ